MGIKAKSQPILTIGIDVFPTVKDGHHYYTAVCASKLFQVDYERLLRVMQEDGLPQFALLPLCAWPHLAERSR